MSDFALPGLMPQTSPLYEALPKRVPLSPHRASSSLWQGIDAIGPIEINNLAPDYPAQYVRMEFRPRLREQDEPVVLESGLLVMLHTGEHVFSGEELAALDYNQIEILDPETWFFQIPPQPLSLAPGLWDWKILIEDTNNVRNVFYEGSLLVRP